MCQHLNYRGSEEEEKGKGPEEISEDIIVKKFSNMGKEMYTQVQEGQSLVQEKPRSRKHKDIIKITKIKHKEKY